MSGVSGASWPGGWQRWHSPETPVRLGVSACLLGDTVRYDGRHKRHSFLTETLASWVEWVRVCPEVEVGMGVPRPPIRLVEDDGRIRLVEPATQRDHTREMARWARRRREELEALGLDGYVLKSASPSCGLGSVKVHRGDRTLHARGTGVFAAELQRGWPGLPAVEEGMLDGRAAREEFAERVFVRNRWRGLAGRGATSPAALTAFHEAHKFLLWARSEEAMRRLGRLLGESPWSRRTVARYEAGLFAVMATPASRGGHVNVLQHARGYVKQCLDPAEARRLDTAIENYRLARVPRSLPLKLLRRFARRCEARYLLGQLYFAPFPEAAALAPDSLDPPPVPFPQRFRDQSVT